MRLIAMEKGMIVCSQLDPLVLWLPPVHSVQNTVSQVSQNSSSCKKRTIGRLGTDGRCVSLYNSQH